jgi:hypothetical protein
MATSVLAQPTENEAESERVPMLIANGFAFQSKEFKVVKLVITGEKGEAESAVAKDNGKTGAKNLKGIFEIGGFLFKLKPVVNGDDVLEADLIERADPISTMEKDSEKKLDVPVGHVSIKAQQPDPKNRVFIGDLRINSEKAEGIKGTFELYLNDHTPVFQQKRAMEGQGQE